MQASKGSRLILNILHLASYLKLRHLTSAILVYLPGSRPRCRSFPSQSSNPNYHPSPLVATLCLVVIPSMCTPFNSLYTPHTCISFLPQYYSCFPFSIFSLCWLFIAYVIRGPTYPVPSLRPLQVPTVEGVQQLLILHTMLMCVILILLYRRYSSYALN